MVEGFNINRVSKDETCPKCNVKMDRCAKITPNGTPLDIFYLCPRCRYYIDTEELSSSTEFGWD